MARAAVIGAGIIGLSVARALLAEGYAVTLVDPDPAGDKASFGNAGGLGVTEIIPAGGPGVLWKVPGWLADPLGPLTIRPRYLPRLLPWFRAFVKSCSAREQARITANLAALLAPVYADYLPLLDELRFRGELNQVGALWVYESEAGFKAAESERRAKRQHAIAFEDMDGAEARRREPALSKTIVKASFAPAWSHFNDPKRLMEAFFRELIARGVETVAGTADAIDGKDLRLRGGRKVPFDILVVAAGAWSQRIAATIGDRVLLESERGYNLTIPRPGVQLTREIIFAERSFVATPMTVGLRIGGAAEFAGLEAPANYARSHALATLAKRYLPDLSTEGGLHWMGHRPATPDSLPVIGVSPARDDVVYAFGHGHIGLTLGPTTGRLVADLVARRQPSIDLTAFRPSRFTD